jgi:hypothetical protein
LRKTNVEPNFGVSETKNTSENIASGTIRLVSSNHHNEEGLTGVNRSARPVRMLCHRARGFLVPDKPDSLTRYKQESERTAPSVTR